MAQTKAAVGDCPMDLALNLISGRWRLSIIWQLSRGDLHYGELQRRVTGISKRILSQDLRELEARGIVHRTALRDGSQKVEYSLSPLGRSLSPLLAELCRWGREKAPELARA